MSLWSGGISFPSQGKPTSRSARSTLQAVKQAPKLCNFIENNAEFCSAKSQLRAEVTLWPGLPSGERGATEWFEFLRDAFTAHPDTRNCTRLKCKSLITASEGTLGRAACNNCCATSSAFTNEYQLLFLRGCTENLK